jgi:hypothetical protein
MRTTSAERCAEKMRYASKKAARQALRYLSYRKRKNLRAYSCDECFAWHLASRN